MCEYLLLLLLILNLKIKIYKPIILPVVLYGCEVWSLTLRDANGEWRRLYNEELHSLYSSPNITRVIKSRRLRWVCHVEWRRVGVLSEKRPLRRPRSRWEDNIRMDPKEMGINTRNGVDSSQDRDNCECGIEPPDSINHEVSYDK